VGRTTSSPVIRQASFESSAPTLRADWAGVGRWDARLLILMNATAAPSSFVASLLVADRSWNPLPILTVAVGLIGCGYFTSRAEGIRWSMHASASGGPYGQVWSTSDHECWQTAATTNILERSDLRQWRAVANRHES
jgi:hypothetical protein